MVLYFPPHLTSAFALPGKNTETGKSHLFHSNVVLLLFQSSTSLVLVHTTDSCENKGRFSCDQVII